MVVKSPSLCVQSPHWDFPSRAPQPHRPFIPRSALPLGGGGPAERHMAWSRAPPGLQSQMTRNGKPHRLPIEGMQLSVCRFWKPRTTPKNESKTRVKLGRPQTWTANTKNVTPKCWKLTSTTHPKPTSTSGVTSCRSVGVKQPGALVKPVANEVETKNYVSICIYVYR